MVGVSTRTFCRQLFKELNVLTLLSLYIMEVISYIRKHHQFVDVNSNIHAHNTRRKMDSHIQSYNTDLYFNFNLFNDPWITIASKGMWNKSTTIDKLKNTVKFIHICRIENSILGQNLI